MATVTVTSTLPDSSNKADFYGIVNSATVTGIQVADFATNIVDTDEALTANSDSRIPSQQAVKAYADGKIASSYLDTDGTLAANSDTKIPSQKAVKTYAMPVGYLDTDGTLAANSDTKVPSQKAIKTYVDGKSAGLGTATTGLSVGTTYQAANDGFIFIKINSTGQINNIYVDTVSPASTLFCDVGNEGASTMHMTATIPIKKNKYFKMTGSATVGNYEFWPFA